MYAIVNYKSHMFKLIDLYQMLAGFALCIYANQASRVDITRYLHL